MTPILSSLACIAILCTYNADYILHLRTLFNYERDYK